MRLTFIIPNNGPSGGNRVVASYSHELARRGHEVSVIYFRSTNYGIDWLIRRLREYIRGRAPQVASYFDPKIVRMIGIERPSMMTDRDVPDADIICSTWWETAELMRQLPASKGVWMSLIQHDESHLGAPKDSVYKTWAYPARIITISTWLVDLVGTHAPNTPVTFISNSTDHQLFNAPPRERSEKLRVGIMYSPIRSKGWDLGVSCLEQVREAIPNATFVAFGNYKRWRKAPIPPWVEYIRAPSQTKLVEIYRSMDCFVCPSRSEGFGLPVLEAMACRTPVASFAVAGPVDLLPESEGGFLCRIGDVSALSKAVIRILTMPANDWINLSEAGAAKARSHSWEKAAFMFECAMNETLEANFAAHRSSE